MYLSMLDCFSSIEINTAKRVERRLHHLCTMYCCIDDCIYSIVHDVLAIEDLEELRFSYRN